MSYYYDDFPKAAPRPRAVAGKERKKFGETWWGKRWVENLSKYEDDQRMARGRAYARADKVKKFEINKGKITAVVQGSSGKYKVNIDFKEYSDEQWKKIVGKIQITPLLLGKLLNNEMPEELEEMTGFKFVPDSFSSKCSCPDYANPCKHIAAVFYTTSDEIDHNPMSLLLIHGLTREELFSRLEMINDMPEKKEKRMLKEKKTKKTGKTKPKRGKEVKTKKK